MPAPHLSRHKWNGRVVELDDWSEFAEQLASELAALGHNGLVAIRNFALSTAIVDEDMNHLGEVDRLALVRQTGTDRDNTSPMWNASGHDYDHDQSPSGKTPADIIYAYVAEVNDGDYLVHYKFEPEQFNLTEGLSNFEGILIYDATKLQRVAKNEHWFLTDPCEALLLVFILIT